MRDTWDSDVLEFIAPGAEDLVVDKNRYDAFLYTDLELLLRNLGISHLVVTGVVTHVCVETTVRSGRPAGLSRDGRLRRHRGQLGPTPRRIAARDGIRVRVRAHDRPDPR